MNYCSLICITLSSLHNINDRLQGTVGKINSGWCSAQEEADSSRRLLHACRLAIDDSDEETENIRVRR
jgi:hypothetical protein